MNWIINLPPQALYKPHRGCLLFSVRKTSLNDKKQLYGAFSALVDVWFLYDGF